MGCDFPRYDIDNSGNIDRGEMVKVMSSIYSMVDGNVSGAMRGGTEEKATKHAERLFKLIDIDGDGNLTENEFLRVRQVLCPFFKTEYQFKLILGLHARCRVTPEVGQDCSRLPTTCCLSVKLLLIIYRYGR